jgi:hypothetical protein
LYGLDWITQVAPFHASIGVPYSRVQGSSKQLQEGLPLLQRQPLNDPTAMQPAAVVHDTPDRRLENPKRFPGSALGVVWTDQAVPFHRSTSDEFPGDELAICPTAVQAFPALQDTPERVPPPGGSVWTTHAVPFHRSANGVLWALWPTAMHRFPRHETPERTPPPVGFAEVWIDHADPSHRSTSVILAPEASTEYPTAVQALAVMQDTPVRALEVAPVGTGVERTDQVVPFHCSASGTSAPEPLT